MRIASTLFCIGAMFCLGNAALGQVTTEKTDAQDILKQLTNQPRQTWIKAGTIEGNHYRERTPITTDMAKIQAKIEKAVLKYDQNTNKREQTAQLQNDKRAAIPFNVKYNLANKYTMSSHEVVKYDGSRFYWEISIDSYTDTVKPDATDAANPMVDKFDSKANATRIFAWDGQKYTTYSKEGGQAVIDASGRLGTPGVNGPLTAGLIPWGTGKFSYERLLSADVSITENNGKSVGLMITHNDGSTTEVTLDPSKAYAVTSATLTTGGFSVSYICSGYESVAGQWVPSSVIINRQNDSITIDDIDDDIDDIENIGGRIATHEVWSNIKVTETSKPSLSSFSVPLALDTTVEYVSPVMASSALYVNSYETDTDELLAQRLAYGAAEGLRPQNCATAALQHVASGFGKPVSNAALANLVGSDGNTNLYDLKQAARSLGLYTRVVNTDLAGLETLGTVKAILHIPGKKHFVVLDRVDDQNVWLVDLSSRRFYHRQSVHFFPLEWTGGTALLVSDRPISGQFAEIPDAGLKDIMGGLGYTCTRLIQEEDYFGCIYMSGMCYGTYMYYWERYGCEQAESGTCPQPPMVRMQESPCIPDLIYECTLTFEWFYYYMRACE